MKIAFGVKRNRSKRGAVLAANVAALLLLAGCSKQEKEQEPEVSVQTTPAQRGPISQTVSTEAVVFPL